MSVQKLSPAPATTGRPISNNSTEYGWCKAVPGGTGHTILALLSSRPPQMSSLENAINRIQLCHPILRSKIHFNPTTNKFSFITYPKPMTRIETHFLPTTTSVLEQRKTDTNLVSPFQVIIEHEMSLDTWANVNYRTSFTLDMFFATIYELPGGLWTMVFRLHVLACDRTAAVALLREMLVLFRSGGGGVVEVESGNKGEVSLAIEDLVPAGKAKKTLWARGIDMLGYSLSSLMLTNLKFKDTRSPRRSEFVRFKMNLDETQKLLAGCEASGIKLCGAFLAAGLIAAHNSSKPKKYGVVTMVDCRPLLDPPLSSHHFGFYHSAILNTHTMSGGERLWELAEKCYKAFADDKNNNKHFSDMADINYLMAKAVENPSLTPSSSLRASLLLVFEDNVVDVSGENRQQEYGLEDYVGCASTHGVGPSVSLLHVVQDGRLDVVCVYPAPLHSREQMQDLVDKMKTVLVAAGTGSDV